MEWKQSTRVCLRNVSVMNFKKELPNTKTDTERMPGAEPKCWECNNEDDYVGSNSKAYNNHLVLWFLIS